MKGTKTGSTAARWLAAMVVVGAVAVMASPRAVAQQEKPKAASAGVAGDWSVSVAAQDGEMPGSMSLKQEGQKVTGTFTSEHSGEVPLEGQYVDGTLTFTITVHGGTDAAMKVDFTGKMKTDGTLAGTLSGPMGDMSWTASRVK